MDEDKKKMIAGLGLIGGAFILLASGIRKKPSPPTFACPYCPETFATLEELMEHIASAHPGQPPVEYGRVWGYIKDEQSGARIANASVYMDGLLETLSDTKGMYGTGNFTFGPHTLMVEADNYETQTIELEIVQESMKLEILLERLPVQPDEWTEGVTVREIEVIPATLYLGNSVRIVVRVDYTQPIPENIHATITVDGTKLSGDFPTQFAVSFDYTPPRIGSFTVVAQDKSAHFVVLQDVTATYFSPIGGTRMPLCTEIVVPDVEPFSLIGHPPHPGGDYIMKGVSQFLTRIPQVADKLGDAYPTAWNPTDAQVNSWVARVGNVWQMFKGVLVMATDYTCKEYWPSKDELAKMIVDQAFPTIWISIPRAWKTQYGTTCPNCGGTGQIVCGEKMRGCHPGELITCPTCGGLGKVFMVNLSSGLRDWVKDIKWHSMCGGGDCIPRVWCPYCDAEIAGPSYTQGLSYDKEALARKLLNHIETKHPSHPLTEPAWF